MASALGEAPQGLQQRQRLSAEEEGLQQEDREPDRQSIVLMNAPFSLPATGVSDTICEPCLVGFSNVSSAYDKCHPWTR